MTFYADSKPSQAPFHQPIPPSIEKTNRPQIKRMWRVPTPLQTTELSSVNEDEGTRSRTPLPKTAIHSHPGQLLDGDFDEEANSKSFQEALKAWRDTSSSSNLAKESTAPPYSKEISQDVEIDSRVGSTNLLHNFNQCNGGNGQQHCTQGGTNEGQQTETTQIEVRFGKNRSYLDELLLKSKYKNSVIHSGNRNELSGVCKCDDTKYYQKEWDDEDEEMLLEILTKRSQKAICTESLVEVISEEEVAIEEEEMAQFKEIMHSRWLLYQSKMKEEIRMEDVTETEDDVILEALDKGRMVECIPSTKLSIIHVE
jgi:hypothetical protein